MMVNCFITNKSVMYLAFKLATMSSSQMSNGIINTVFITNIVTVNIRNYCVCLRLGKKKSRRNAAVERS